jgi:hypothetical protein
MWSVSWNPTLDMRIAVLNTKNTMVTDWASTIGYVHNRCNPFDNAAASNYQLQTHMLSSQLNPPSQQRPRLRLAQELQSQVL